MKKGFTLVELICCVGFTSLLTFEIIILIKQLVKLSLIDNYPIILIVLSPILFFAISVTQLSLLQCHKLDSLLTGLIRRKHTITYFTNYLTNMIVFILLSIYFIDHPFILFGNIICVSIALWLIYPELKIKPSLYMKKIEKNGYLISILVSLVILFFLGQYIISLFIEDDLSWKFLIISLGIGLMPFAAELYRVLFEKGSFILINLIFTLTVFPAFALVIFLCINNSLAPKKYTSKFPKCYSSPLVINFNDKEDFNASEDAKKVKVLQQWNDCFGNFVLVNNEIPGGYVTHIGEFKEGKLNGMGKIYFKNGTILEGKFTDGELIEEIKFIFD